MLFLASPSSTTLDAARFHHPFQTVIAIFTADGARREAAPAASPMRFARRLELAEGLGDRRPLTDAVAPLVERPIPVGVPKP